LIFQSLRDSLGSKTKSVNIECNLDRNMWYADDCGAGATFNDQLKYFDLLKVLSLPKGYTPDACVAASKCEVFMF